MDYPQRCNVCLQQVDSEDYAQYHFGNCTFRFPAFNLSVDGDDLSLVFLDGRTVTVTMPSNTGPEGPQGPAGSNATDAQVASAVATYISAHPPTNGTNGVGYSSGAINESGHLILTKTDSTTVDCGYVVGPAGATGASGTNATTTATATNSTNGLMASTDKEKLDAYPLYNAPFSLFQTRSIVTSSTSTGFQVSSTRLSMVRYSVTISSSVQIGVVASVSGTVVLEIAATNSSTPSDWTEVGRFTNGQVVGLAVALSLAQTLSGQITATIPAGYYVRIRSINNAGTPTFSFNSGQETLL